MGERQRRVWSLTPGERRFYKWVIVAIMTAVFVAVALLL